MSKINEIGIPARDIDRIINRAIRLIGTGEHKYSCCALTAEGDLERCWKVRKAYTRTFSPVTDYVDNYGYSFVAEVKCATNSPNEAENLRILMLSLFRAAWRDLV